jgi:tetratricopeptide (TPR) repeat protein
MKHRTFLALFFVSLIHLNAQNRRLDSLKQELKTARHDSTRCNVLTLLIEAAPDGEWEKYNEDLKTVSEKNIRFTKNNPTLQNVFKRHYAAYLNNVGFIYNNKGEIDTALSFFNKSLEIKKEINDLSGMAFGYSNLGYIFHNKGNTDKALEYYLKSLEMGEKAKDKVAAANSLNNIAGIFENKGDILKAIEFYQKSLKYREEINEPKGVAMSLNNLANIYKRQGDMDKALDYYLKSLKIRETIGDKISTATSLNNLGTLYFLKKDFKTSRNYHYQSLKIREEIGDKKGIANSLANIGNIYIQQEKPDSALALFERSVKLSEELEDKKALAGVFCNMSRAFSKKNDFQRAKIYGEKSLELSKGIRNPENIKDASELLYIIYKKQNNISAALKMHELFIAMRDSINNKETRKASLRSQFKYEYEKKETEARAAAKAEKEKIELAAHEEKKQQSIIIYSVISGLILLGIFSIFIFRSLQQNKRANKIISAQKHEVEEQKDLIEEKQKEIVDSINYAKRLQTAILPPKEYIDKYLPDNFVFYRPKDIVAGDFYWMEHLDNITMIAAADSTGHGVPGALVSVVCSTALNRAALEFGLRKPGDLLDKATEIVLETFAKSGEEIKDGMDVSLLAIDHLNRKIYWSGANNPLWYFGENKNEIIEITANKQPVGKSEKRVPFTTHEIPYSEGSIFYLMTDGYPDQFGGPKGKKFKHKQLSEILINQSSGNLQAQKAELENKFNNWKGNLEQVDDVCIIGIRL